MTIVTILTLIIHGVAMIQDQNTGDQRDPNHFDYQEAYRRAGLLVGRLETGWNGNFHSIMVDGPFSEQDFQSIPRPMVLDLGKVDFAHYPITPTILKQVCLSPKLWSLTIRKLNGKLPSDWLSWIQSDNFQELILVGVSVDLDMTQANLGELAILSLSKTPFDLSLARQIIELPKIATVRLDGDQIDDDAFLLLGNSKTLEYIIIRGNYSQDSIERLERTNPRLKIERTTIDIEPPPFRINSIRSASRTLFAIQIDAPFKTKEFLDIPRKIRANAVALDFGFHEFDSEMLKAIKSCARLKSLVIHNPHDLPYDWPKLLPSSNLRTLDFYNGAFELSPRGPLKNLETLRIQDSPMSAERASQLAALKELKYLDMFNCPADKEILKQLSKSKSLVALKLSKTTENARDIEEFRANNPRIQISTEALEDVEEIAPLEEDDPTDESEAVELIQINPFSRRKVVQKVDHLIVKAHDRSIYGLEFSPDGRFLAVWGDEQLRIWDVTAEEFIKEYEATDCILSVLFTDDSKDLFLLAQEGYVFTINLQSWHVKQAFRANHRPQVVRIQKNGQRIVTGPSDIEMFDPLSYAKLGEFVAHNAGGRTMLLADDGRRIVTATADKTVKVWDVGQQQPMHTLTFGNWTTVAAPKDQSRIAIASTFQQDNRQQSVVVLYQSSDMELLHEIKGAVLDGALTCDSQLCFSSDGSLLSWVFWGDHDTGEVINNEIQTRHERSLTIWSMTSFKKIASYRLNPKYALISPDSKRIAIANRLGELEIWELDAFLRKFQVYEASK